MSESGGVSKESLIEQAKAHAKTVSLSIDYSTVSWDVSERARRRAGQCIYDKRTGEVTIRLTWAAFEAYGWESFSGVVRHELVHAWEFQQFGESGHGERFREKAREVDAPRRCERFTEGRLSLTCTNARCDWRAERHRASTVVTNPARYRCGECQSRLVIRHAKTGRSWQSQTGYRNARSQIADDW